MKLCHVSIHCNQKRGHTVKQQGQYIIHFGELPISGLGTQMGVCVWVVETWTCPLSIRTYKWKEKKRLMIVFFLVYWSLDTEVVVNTHNYNNRTLAWTQEKSMSKETLSTKHTSHTELSDDSWCSKHFKYVTVSSVSIFALL